MRPISFQQKMNVIELYLEGLSANEIVGKGQVSKGAVISILKDAREGKFPELELKEKIDELHQISIKLRKNKLYITQAKTGFTFFKRLLDMGIEPDKLEAWIDFCSAISPTPPEGFVPAAMELLNIERTTGKGYVDIASEVKELSDQRVKLLSEVEHLKSDEKRAKELRTEIEKTQKEVNKLAAEKDKLESATNSLNSYLQKKAEQLGISIDELSARFKELLSLEGEMINKKSEKNKLEGEIEALTERQVKLSSRMEKASQGFAKDLELVSEMRDELIEITEMKGRYEQEVKELEWAARILPFLRDPNEVDDPDLQLASAVVNCIDKWLPQHKEIGIPQLVNWREIKAYVFARRK